MEVWVKTDNNYPNNVAKFKLEFHNSSHSSIVQTESLNLPKNTSGWIKVIKDFITGSTVDHLFATTLDFTPSSSQTGKIWYDRANFYELNLTKTFADGLGRDIETMQFEGNNRSTQAATYYDFADRVSKVTKSFFSADTNFTLTLSSSGATIAIDSASQWYATKHPAYNSPNEYDISYPTNADAFSATDYWADPLNRVKYQYFPGTAFSKPSTDPNKKYVKNFYTANQSNELGFAANKVLETRTLDENGVLTEIFTDTFGNKVGVRVDSANATPADSTKLATLFQYDILNNLIKIVPPKAFQSNGNTPSLTSPLCTNLTYNTLSLLTTRKTPDAGTDSMYYDKKGNLRFVKDAKGAAGNYFIYYKYDNLGRKIEEGTMTPVSGNFKQANADISTFPTTGNTWKMIYYYDTSADPNQHNLKGRLNRIDYKTDRFPNMTGYLFYSYDGNGNIEWLAQYIPRSNNNDGNGYFNTRIDYQYDALGKVTKMYYRQTFPPGVSSDAFYVWYDYDALSSLERVFTNTADVKPLSPINAQYTYWPSGQVRRLVLGNTVQGVDYLYNSRDWLTQINHQNLSPSQDPGGDGGGNGVNTDKFGQIIGYNKQNHIASASPFTNDYAAKYNGNITWTILQTYGNTNPAGLTGWVFKYDNAQRLTKANWGHYTSNWVEPNSGYDLTGIKYDRNGNLDYMTRYNQSGALTNMDYVYNANTNKLNYVGGLNTSGNYDYDANGNMIKDAAKINPTTNTITYDYRNLPIQVTKSVAPAGTIYFGYDGKGQRVSKNNLFYIPDAEGRVIAVYDISGTHLYWNIWGLDLIGQRYWKP